MRARKTHQIVDSSRVPQCKKEEKSFALQDMKNVASAMLPMMGSVWALSMLPKLIGKESKT